MTILIEVAPGELIDKLTILEIKKANISDPAKLRNVAQSTGCWPASWPNRSRQAMP